MSKNIAILSTVVNFDLYRKSALLFPDVPKYVIDGRNGMHSIDTIVYMFKKLRNHNIDWLIMADEDVLFIDRDLVFGLIDKMVQEQITVCGVRDGGVIPHRTQNPYAINTFFSILNFKEVLSIWDANEVLKNQYVKDGEFKDDLSELPFDYNTESTFEPYYCFYFWLRRKGKKILFLDAEVPFKDDSIANLVKDSQGKELLYHTWYARAYGNSEKHTQRIDSIFDQVSFDHAKWTEPVVFKDPTFALRKQIRKQSARVLNKIKSLMR